MGRIKKTVLGTPIGKIGDLTFRIRRGNIEVYATPLPSEIPPSEAAASNRTRFAFHRKLSAGASRTHLLKEIWMNSELPGYAAFEKIMKVNFHLASGPEELLNIRLVPSDVLFNSIMQSFILDDEALRLTVEPITNTGLNSRWLPDITAQGIILLSGAAEDKPPYRFLPLSSGTIPFQNETPFNFKIGITGNLKDALEDYSRKQFIVVLIIKDMQGQPKYFSKNLSGEV